MPPTAVAFKLFQVEEAETTAADLFLVLGKGGDGTNTIETEHHGHFLPSVNLMLCLGFCDPR
jgi:hypothetical protein